MPNGRGDERRSAATLHGMSSVLEMRDEWEDLATRTNAPVFNRPGWLIVWQRHLAPSAEPTLLVARDDTGMLTGVLPLAGMTRQLHSRVPVRVRYMAIAGAGVGSADHNGPVATDDATAATLFEAAAQHARSASLTLYLENLAPRWADVARAAIGGDVTRRTECPAVDRTADGKFSDAWSKKMVKNIRRRQRMLDEAGITTQWVPAGAEFDAALDDLRRVHVGRWNAQGGEGNLTDVRMRLLRDLAAECVHPNVPWILLLRQGDRAVAGMLGIRSGDSFSVYKTGWDPEFTQLSLGVMMGALAMEWAEASGLTTFDYLRGPRGHKKDLGCVSIADVSLIWPKGISGAVLEQRERFAADGVRPQWWTKVEPVISARLRPSRRPAATAPPSAPQ
ncbi:MAG: GNAT family N-acetyltransferase [Actinomycetes bacterium]